MQSEGLVLMLLIIVSIPVMIFTSNHNIFFILAGLVIIFFSLVNLNDVFQYKKVEDGAEENEDIEGLVNIDIKKFGMGIEFVKELTIILLFVYCAMYVQFTALKVIIAFAISYRVLDICLFLIKKSKILDHFNSIFLFRLITLLVNLANILIIIPVAYNKFISPIF